MKKQLEQKVTISFSEHITENFKQIKIPFFKIMDLVKSKFNYSSGVFKNGYRNKDNYLEYSDLVIFDIDDGCTIDEAKKIFEPFDYILATTKSHQKEKNGVVCDRFRIILKTETPITLNKEDYSKLMEEVFKDFPFVDTVCKDASRFYFPSADSEIYIHAGFTDFDWQDIWNERCKLDKETEERLKQFKENYVGFKKVNSNNYQSKNEDYGLEHIDAVRKMCFTDKILEKLKANVKMISGQRNTTLYSYLRYFEGLGMPKEEIKDNILWINANSNGISEEEIHKTIFKRLKG